MAASASTKLSASAVLALIFFNVSGGPLGSEQIVAYGGPLPGLAALVAFAFVFALPQALITAELSAAFPSNGGYSIWAREAFGDFVAVQGSFWGWTSGVIDSALYPALLYSAASKTALFDWLPTSSHAGGGVGSWDEYLAKVVLLVLFSLPNLVSSRAVGNGLVVLGFLVMAPYVVMVLIAVPHLQPSNLLEKPKRFRPFEALGVIFWSLTGFDSASTYAGEVDRPQKTMPRVLIFAVFFQVCCYVLPLSFAAMVDADWMSWAEGSLTDVAAKEIGGGKWLATWTLVSAVLSNWGLFASELFEDSYTLVGMGEVGLAPRCFARQSYSCRCRFGRSPGCATSVQTPVAALLFQLLLIALLLGLDYSQILCIDNFFSAAQAALEFAAALKLRISQPSLSRPFRVPLGTFAFALVVVVPPLLISLVIMVTTACESTTTIAVTLGSTAAGLLVWPLSRIRLCSRRRSPMWPSWVMQRLHETAAPDDWEASERGAESVPGRPGASRYPAPRAVSPARLPPNGVKALDHGG